MIVIIFNVMPVFIFGPITLPYNDSVSNKAPELETEEEL
jgi:hypothetical protein